MFLKTANIPFREGANYSGVNTTSASFIIASMLMKTEDPCILLAPDKTTAGELAETLRLWMKDRVVLIPEPPLTPYHFVDLSVTVRSGLINGWAGLKRGEYQILVMTPALSLFPPPRTEWIDLSAGETCSRDSLVSRLIGMNFRRVDLCEEWGDMAVRGALVDIYPPNLEKPIRVEFEGDRLTTIRNFDIQSQRTIAMMDRVSPFSFSLIPHDRESDLISILEKRSTGLGGDRIITRVRETGENGPISLWYPLVTPPELPDGLITMVYDENGVRQATDRLRETLEDEARECKDTGFFDVPETMLFPEIQRNISPGVSFERIPSRESNPISSQGLSIVRGNLQTLTNELNRLHSDHYDIVLTAATEHHERTLENLIREDSIEGIRIERAILQESWVSPEFKLAIIPDSLVFGKTVIPGKKKDIHQAFRVILDQTKPGDPLIHIEHGIGYYRGLKIIDLSEYVHLEYDDGELFVPVENLDMLSTFVGADDTLPPAHRLGGKTWRTQKKKAKKIAEDLVEELSKKYAERQMCRGISFPSDDSYQTIFESSFAYELTEDQSGAIQDVKSDMESERPMDRLLCGDVGFGKTEVALRAAFKAVNSGYQVCILAPTTVLAYQHFRNARERFHQFPVSIRWISRFLHASKQKAIIDETAGGTVDILIGTHRLLSRDVSFSRLGLLIIDEEQRFGVKQKEKIRGLKKNADILAMSATPIPRTFYLSLMGVRDLSVISTPPLGRYSIETSVTTIRPHLIRDAILYEIERGGQVFFIHNRVQEIHEVYRFLEELVPELDVTVTHGQMGERDLEKNLLRFVQGDAHVLLTTTIIENGMDIPRANTMIINNANTFGLSQLYQLRGRVGRSSVQAYCYLLVPSIQSLPEPARARLSALEEFSQLGSGFKVAARDLNIRGAGNILGVEQHGHIQAVGYELFCRLVENASREIKGEEPLDHLETRLSLGIPAAIPEGYISDEIERLSFYRKCQKENIDSIYQEMRDRFGPVPDSMKQLLELFRIRQYCRTLRIGEVVKENDILRLKFNASTPLPVETMIDFVQRYPSASLSPEGLLTLPAAPDGPEILERLRSMLESFIAAMT